jgi:hypothetical protein
MIAIEVGVITVSAVVLGFAGDVLGLPWHWMRPAAELLLLAELVGLVVLERYQLFEPVHEKVDAMQGRMEEMHAMMMEGARTSGQVTACTSTPEVYRTMARVAREALARDQHAPQLFRIARLGRVRTAEDPDLASEFREWVSAFLAYFVNPGSPPDGRARRWSIRWIVAFASLQDFDLAFEPVARQALAGNPANVELKILVRPRIESMLSPAVMTDRDVIVVFDDATAALRWGVSFQGPQYLALFQRWFDDLWASISDSYLIYSRTGLNQAAIDLIRNELETRDGAQVRQTA